jgi:hypothetical protein
MDCFYVEVYFSREREEQHDFDIIEKIEMVSERYLSF